MLTFFPFFYVQQRYKPFKFIHTIPRDFGLIMIYYTGCMDETIAGIGLQL
jgi:hypothetical protein